MSKIPFNRPAILGKELEYIAQAIANGHAAGDGEFTRRCNALLEEALSVRKVLLTTSCTHALEASALLLGVGPDDEVIVPSFTFVSTANAFALRGARLVFADVREDTLNLDERQLASLITSQTRVVVPVHYAGVGCEMDAILAETNRREIDVVEDNAHGLFAKYRGRMLGSLGRLATQSFHETKNVTCGEGGALLINDESLIQRAEIVREKGTDRSRFFRGEVNKYTWVELGSSYLPSDVLAAFLYAQLEAREEITARRKRAWDTYDENLRSWAKSVGARGPIVPDHCEQSYHMYYLLLPTPAARTALIAALRASGIAGVFHYLPLHLSRMGRQFGGRNGQCPVAESIADRIVRLPLYNDFTTQEQARVIETVQNASV